MLWKRNAGIKFYKKAPSKFPMYQAKRLRWLALCCLLLSIDFIVLSNPLTAYDQLKSLPIKTTEIKKVLASIPAFIKVFPNEVEKNRLAFFDWTETQLNHALPIFAKETLLGEQVAGQSAVVEITPPVALVTPELKDYAALPFFIEIPKLNVYEKVSANVDPNNAKEYKAALANGVAHALNSSFPGQNKLIYIFGHSTDGAWNVEAYNAVFYQIKNLQVGDQIILHLGEEQFVYVVSRQDVVASSAVDFVNNLSDQNVLLLQTCWPPGTSWQRLFVTATPVS
jgi:LPXTG-site transpeptidase (sortase) family protein